MAGEEREQPGAWTITVQIDIHAGSQWRAWIGLPGVAWLERYGRAEDEPAARLAANGAAAELLRELADAILWLDRRPTDAAVPRRDALALAGSIRARVATAPAT